MSSATPDTGGIVFSNPGSGPSSSPTTEDVAEALSPFGVSVEALDRPEELPRLARRALDAGHRPIGVSGGDGTVRCVAEVLVGTDVPLLVVPGGTRNHFATELGIDSLDDAVTALREGTTRHVSLGSVNGAAFVNNASIGLYPDLVRRRERAQHRIPKSVANVTAAASLMRHGRPIDVTVEGTEVSAWLVFIGNGRYGDGFTDLIERESLDAGILDVRLVRADRRLARLRVVLAVAAGRLASTPLVISNQTSKLALEVRSAPVRVALDGELFEMTSPLDLEVRQSVLTVVAPSGREAGDPSG